MSARFLWVLLLGISSLALVRAEDPAKADSLALSLRMRVETFKGTGTCDEVTLKTRWAGKETALVICDMWDKHWCHCATRRCDVLAKKAAPVVNAYARKA